MHRFIDTAPRLPLALRAIRCFNAAAFAALAFFYFGMHCLGSPAIGQIALTPLAPATPMTSQPQGGV